MAARLALVLLMVFAGAGPVAAQSVITATSDPTIQIHSTFAGETITLFGNIEPDIAQERLGPGPFEVVVALRGPVADRVVRFRSRRFGIMLNSDHAVFENLPAFYRVLSSAPLEEITTPQVLEENRLTLAELAESTIVETSGRAAIFQAQLVRLMGEENLFAADARGVNFLSPTFFSARVSMPANVPNGSYLAHTYVFSEGEMVAERASRFIVRTAGLERFLGESARDMPLLYGLATVLVALLTGWLGGVVFRR